tara:strand:+ start:25 stop:942 length:918 start_codon:yes stop_codon:yes gene_type:complete
MKLNSFIKVAFCLVFFSCDEDSLIVQPVDCNGVPLGNAQEDNCGICDEDPSNDCSQDCAGTWGGQSTEDLCGVCDGDSSACSDCFGIPNGDGLEDFDGNCYEVVEIGNQIWMAENLKVSHYNNGDQIPSNFIQIPNNDFNNFDLYGFLYQGYAFYDIEQNICPLNWHVPTDEEWMELEMFLGMSQSEAEGTLYRGTNEGSKLASNAELWNNQADWGEEGFLEEDPEFGSSGFNAIPAGSCGGWHMGGLIPEGTSSAMIFTSSSNINEPNPNLYVRFIDDHSTTIWRNDARLDWWPNCGSIRCIKD